MRLSTKKAFTLIELMVVMAIIAVLAVIVIGGFAIARRTATNTRIISDAKTIAVALDAYKTKNKRFPSAVGTVGCGGYEVGNSNNNNFLTALAQVGLEKTPVDPVTKPAGSCVGYKYYRYPAQYGCPKPFYVLGVYLQGGAPNPNTTSPGWSCPTRDWGTEFDWVIGDFE